MRASRKRLLWIALVAVALSIVVGVALWFWFGGSRLPKPGEPLYEEYVEAFEAGTAALDSGLNPEAEEHLTRAIKLVPAEPAAWANRGLTYLRSRDLKKAEADLNKAARLAPGNADVEEMLGILAEDRGDYKAAIAHVEKALKVTPDDVRRLYRLAHLIEQRSDPNADERRAELFERIVRQRPTSLPILVARLQLAARAKDKKALDETVARLKKLAPQWAAEAKAREELAKFEEKAKGDFDAVDLASDAIVLRNRLTVEPGFARSANELEPPPAFPGAALQNFLRLAPIRTTPDEPDAALTFEPRANDKLAEGIGAAPDVVVPFWSDGDAGVRLLAADATGVSGSAKLTLPANDVADDLFRGPLSMDGVLPVDLNNDGVTDLVLAGPAGAQVFFRRKGAFEKGKLPADVAGRNYYGAWAADVDMDGDLDVILAVRDKGVLLLVNNANDTFTPRSIFPDVQGARAFVWADLDNDGAPDAALLDDKGALHVYMNERSAQFTRLAVPGDDRYAAVTAAEITEDGTFDLIAVTLDCRLIRLSHDGKQGWQTKELVKPSKTLPLAALGQARLQAIDVDSNGAIDLVLRTPKGGVAWLRDGEGWVQLEKALPPGLTELFPDETGSLVVVSQEKPKPECLVVKGTKGYNHDVFQPRHDPAAQGDQRMNSFAIGSELEVRSGSLIVKQLVERPVAYVGLGRKKKVVVTRVVWPNGTAQYEFDRPTNAKVKIVQRLKGSCPFLFTWDGTKMVFVTDFCWSTPLGLYINAVKRGGGFRQTTEWMKVRGDQLVPRGDVYDLRVNANLWETHYLDLLALMTVDHPPGTEVYVDERFFLQQTAPRLYLTTPSRPVARAVDHLGKDVTAIVREDDGKYLASAGLGKYQGLTQDHWVEIDVGDVPGDGPLYLLARGWLQPTDSSINVALEQRGGDRPTPLALEVFDGREWKQHGPLLGFPAGKNKTLVIRLEAAMRRIRLRTNMEIYWDSLRVARGLDESQCVVRELTARTAELRYRGVLRMTRESRTSPEIPHYDRVSVSMPWRDLIGYHTRFGDVRELITGKDDRYAMMNAGDELLLTFAVPEAPREGWRRDFVWVSDGWTKDGDFNTKYGKTVLPLPYHDMKDYDAPPGRLEDDPVYKMHPNDWKTYHTRYVTPETFRRGLRR